MLSKWAKFSHSNKEKNKDIIITFTGITGIITIKKSQQPIVPHGRFLQKKETQQQSSKIPFFLRKSIISTQKILQF